MLAFVIGFPLLEVFTIGCIGNVGIFPKSKAKVTSIYMMMGA